MRSDFYSLPYAARQAIRRGEAAEHDARWRSYTISELRAENEKLRIALRTIRDAKAPKDENWTGLLNRIQQIAENALGTQ